MKVKFVLALLLIACLVLAGVFYSYRSEAQVKLENLGNENIELNSKLKDYTEQNMDLNTRLQKLQGDLEAVQTVNEGLSNELARTTARLNKTEADASVAAKNAEEEIARKNQQIEGLNTERADLLGRLAALDESIQRLENELNETSGKLDISEKNREFLIKELKRLQTEKAELERQLNSIDFLTEQVRRLKQETSVSGRLDIVRKGIYGFRKGGERMVFSSDRAVRSLSRTNYNLNVEIHQDGQAEVTSPEE
ncbi:MAG: hypothetical protein ACOX2U_05390 [Limisphaerales bacterium]|jgi:chromosome segregation ATPase|nr:hypothetical protein [Verrucomicrobiota bacterium]